MFRIFQSVMNENVNYCVRLLLSVCDRITLNARVIYVSFSSQEAICTESTIENISREYLIGYYNTVLVSKSIRVRRQFILFHITDNLLKLLLLLNRNNVFFHFKVTLYSIITLLVYSLRKLC